PDTPVVTKRSTSDICDSRSSSRSGPRQMIDTPSSFAAFAAPAWMLCQKTCDVPFGTTAIVNPPVPAAGARLHAAAKSSSANINLGAPAPRCHVVRFIVTLQSPEPLRIAADDCILLVRGPRG